MRAPFSAIPPILGPTVALLALLGLALLVR